MGGKGKRTTEPTPKTPLAVAQQAIHEALVTLLGRIRLVSKDLEAANEHDRDKASHLAWLTKQVAQIAGEQRKLEAHDAKGARDLDPAAVAAYLRQLQRDEWEHLRSEVDEGHRGGSVLA